MASGAGFRLFTAGLLPKYGESVIHRDTFNKILGTIYEEVDGGIQAQLKKQYDSTRELGWTGPFFSVQIDLTVTHNEEYATMSVSFVPPSNWNELVRLSVDTRAFPGTHTARDIEKFLKEVGGDMFQF